MAGIDNIVLHLIDGIRPTAKDRWSAVVHQAIRHTREVMPYELLKDQRPNESDYIRDYRLKNYRYFTNEGVLKFNDKSARIINRSNYSILNESEDLRDWLVSYDFKLGNGESASFSDYFSRYILPCSFEDPNALLVAFPYNANNPDIAPGSPISEGGLSPNERVSIDVKVIPSERVTYVNYDGFAYYGGMMEFKSKGETKKADYFWACDDMAWYIVIPVGVKQRKNGTSYIEYEAVLWYVHDTGLADETQVPLNILGGTITKMPENDNISYYESFLKPYYEYADEAICTFSDFQAVRVQNAYPVKVMTKRPCHTCNGQGKERISGKGSEVVIQTCSSCGGSGVEAGLSPFKELIVEDSHGLGEKASNRKPLEYVSPDTSILEFMDKAWRQMISDARRAVNLDLLEDVQESGEAKKVRLQDLQDMLSKIGGNMFEVMERLLWFTECLLQPNRNERQVPVIVRPVSYDIKSEQMLQDEAKTAHPADSISSLMAFYKKRYAGDDKMIRIKELALSYAPLLAITDPNELQLRLMGAYSDADLVKRDRAEWAIKKIANDVDIFDERRETEIFRLADELIRPFIPNTPTTLM